MKVYKDDSDKFDPEYLAYLDTLTSEVGAGRFRITRNPENEVVRFEFWPLAPGEEPRAYAYYDFPLPGWMRP